MDRRQLAWALTAAGFSGGAATGPPLTPSGYRVGKIFEGDLDYGLNNHLHHAGPIDTEPSGGDVAHRVAGFLAAIGIDTIER